MHSALLRYKVSQQSIKPMILDISSCLLRFLTSEDSRLDNPCNTVQNCSRYQRVGTPKQVSFVLSFRDCAKMNVFRCSSLLSQRLTTRSFPKGRPAHIIKREKIVRDTPFANMFPRVGFQRQRPRFNVPGQFFGACGDAPFSHSCAANPP